MCALDLVTSRGLHVTAASHVKTTTAELEVHVGVKEPTPTTPARQEAMGMTRMCQSVFRPAVGPGGGHSPRANLRPPTRLSQSPRLDSDVAIHSRRKGLIESTLAPVALMGGDRKLTALGYPSQAPSAAFISVFVLRHGHIFPVSRLGRPALPARCYFCG